MPRGFKIKAAPKCSVCQKSAYPNERVDIFNLSVHKLCFNCTTCAKKLTLSGACINTDTGLLFCKTHFADQLRVNDGARYAKGSKNVAQKMKAQMELKKPGSSKSMGANQTQGGLLQEDLDFLRLAKYDRQLEAQVQKWVDSVSGHSIAERGDGTFSGGLRDGVILCYLMQTLVPGSIPRIQESSQVFKQMENIKHFLAALRTEFKFAENEVFSTLDLTEESNLNQVLQAFCTLHRKVGDNADLKHYIEGHNLVVRDMSAAVEKAEQELARRRKEKGEALNKTTPKKAAPAAPAAPAATPTPAPTPTKSEPTASKSNEYDKSEFYMQIGEDTHGPYVGTEMSTWFAAGDVSPECWCSCDGGDWKMAKEFFGKSEAASPAPAVAAEPAVVAEPAKASGGTYDSSEFYMMIGEDTHGPYVGKEMSSWVAAGDVSPECWCSCDGGDWKMAKEFF
jgi:hypothetical protein